jgi:hypothetical protein
MLCVHATSLDVTSAAQESADEGSQGLLHKTTWLPHMQLQALSSAL